jgi:hypothetical protein
MISLVVDPRGQASQPARAAVDKKREPSDGAYHMIIIIIIIRRQSREVHHDLRRRGRCDHEKSIREVAQPASFFSSLASQGSPTCLPACRAARARQERIVICLTTRGRKTLALGGMGYSFLPTVIKIFTDRQKVGGSTTAAGIQRYAERSPHPTMGLNNGRRLASPASEYQADASPRGSPRVAAGRRNWPCTPGPATPYPRPVAERTRP